MSLLIGATCVAALAFVLTWGGPALVRAAAPVLMRVPRLAVVALLSLPLLFWAVIFAVSLIAAWLLKGPNVLPMPIGEVCQRCLVASSPFGGTKVDTLVPVVLFLLLPAVISIGFLIRGAMFARRRRHENAGVAQLIDRRAVNVNIAGRTVKAMKGQHLLAFSLPRRYGGVVLSEGLCSMLEPGELTAVLEHERAHVDQGHHAIMAMVEAFVRPLRFVPLFAEIATTVPLYLEIAADARAKKAAGTLALASALLKIGPPVGGGRSLGGSYAMNVAGPDRVKQLVAPGKMSPGMLPTLALSSALAAFGVLFSSVIAAYVDVLLTGCTLS